MAWVYWIIFAVILLIFFFAFKNRSYITEASNIFLRERRKSRQLKIINRIRKKRGLLPLVAYYAIDKIAKGHSKYMARHHTCNHKGFSRRAARVRKVTGKGYVGENCYMYPARKYNKRVAAQLIRGWMKSPGHRRNILGSRYTKIGIGIVSKKKYIYATQIFCN